MYIALTGQARDVTMQDMEGNYGLSVFVYSRCAVSDVNDNYVVAV